MNWKKILALALFLGLLAAAITWIERREKARPTAEGTLLDIPTGSVEKIELRNGSGHFVFRRRDTMWYVEQPLAVKADKVALESILDNFCELKYDRLVAEDGRELNTFGLDKPGTELTLFVAGKPAATVLLGVRNELDDSSYARLASGSKVVSLAAYKRNDLEKDLFAFRDKRFFAIDTMAVTALDLRHGENRLALAKKDGRWFLEKPVYSLASAARVDEVLASASTLEALSFIPATGAPAQHGLDKPLLSAEFKAPGGSQRIVAAKSGEQAFARVEGAAEICGISPGFLDKFAGDATAWREKKVAPFYAYDVRELSLRREGLQFTVRKDAAGAWAFAGSQPGRQPAVEKIESLLTALAELEAVEFIDAPRPRPEAGTRIALKTEDQVEPGKRSEIVLEFGAGAEETVIVRNPALPYAFQVARGILDKFPAKIEDVTAETAATSAPGKR
ncbi:MAG: DUF4340 domain-containing protein [Acidobacteria bacterium]|nr:DUF4340 domain-containing protein [Acidobacteriota bacterium]